jgi:cyclin A
MRMTRLASRQMQQDAVAPLYSDGANPMSVEKDNSEIIDVDAPDHADTQLCVAYVRDIYDHLGEIEQQHRIATQYMHSQRDINSTMRGILIDWLVEVAEEYRLVPETLYLAVNYIDRFLQWVPVNRGKLQLVGVTCMLIASYARAYTPAPASPRVHTAAS